MGCALPLAHPLSCINMENDMKITGKVANDGFKAVSAEHYITSRHKIPRIWIVVADRHKFRVFMKPDGHLEQIAEGFPHAEGHTQDISDHTFGRIVSSASVYIRHSLSSGKKPAEKDAVKFVKDIAAWLDEAVKEDSYDRLVLAASPKMLGDIRKVLSYNVHARITAEINKDLTKMRADEILEELKEIVWF